MSEEHDTVQQKCETFISHASESFSKLSKACLVFWIWQFELCLGISWGEHCPGCSLSCTCETKNQKLSTFMQKLSAFMEEVSSTFVSGLDMLLLSFFTEKKSRMCNRWNWNGIHVRPDCWSCSKVFKNAFSDTRVKHCLKTQYLMKFHSLDYVKDFIVLTLSLRSLCGFNEVETPK